MPAPIIPEITFPSMFSLALLWLFSFVLSSVVGWKGYPRTGYILVGKQTKKKSTFRNVRVGTIEWNVIIPMHCPMAGPSCSAGCETPSGTALSTAALRSPGPGTRPPGCVSPWPGSVSELQFALVPWAASRLAWGHFSLGITYRLSWREKVTFSLSYLPTACLCVPTCTQSHLCPWAHTHACRLPIPSSHY